MIEAEESPNPQSPDLTKKNLKHAWNNFENSPSEYSGFDYKAKKLKQNEEKETQDYNNELLGCSNQQNMNSFKFSVNHLYTSVRVLIYLTIILNFKKS